MINSAAFFRATGNLRFYTCPFLSLLIPVTPMSKYGLLLIIDCLGKNFKKFKLK